MPTLRKTRAPNSDMGSNQPLHTGSQSPLDPFLIAGFLVGYYNYPLGIRTWALASLAPATPCIFVSLVLPSCWNLPWLPMAHRPASLPAALPLCSLRPGLQEPGRLCSTLIAGKLPAQHEKRENVQETQVKSQLTGP